MERRRYSPREKLAIVLEGLRDGGQIAEVCRRRGISVTQFYTWKKKLVEGAGEIFKRKRDARDREMERLKEALGRKDRVIAEITAENLDLKKTPGA